MPADLQTPNSSGLGNTSGGYGVPPEDTLDLLKDTPLDTPNTDKTEGEDKGGDDTPEKVDTKSVRETLDTDDDGNEIKSEETEEEDKKKLETKVAKELEDEIDEEDEEEKVDEEKLELTVPARRKDILAKYPTLFKDFPYLERAYYREQQFTELLPTIDDAKVAIEKAQTLDQFEQQVMSGNTEQVLQVLKQNNPKGFHKAVDEYLPTLAKVDERAHLHVVGNVLRLAINNMLTTGHNMGENGTPLATAARILNQFVFGDAEAREPQRLSREEPRNEELETLKKERYEGAKARFIEKHTEVVTRVQNTLKSTINTHIDPNKLMTDYVRKNATNDAYKDLEKALGSDARFRGIIDKLWEQAHKSGYSRESLDRVRSAYLSKSKAVLPQVILKSRNEALKGLGQSVNTNDKEQENKGRDKRGPIPVGKSAAPASGTNSTSRTKLTSEMKTLDYLNAD